MSLETSKRSYICPGESYSISHAVHLARQLACYPSCRTCPHNNQNPATDANSITDEDKVSTLLHTDGIRGLFQNELNRAEAAHWALAFTELIADSFFTHTGITDRNLVRDRGDIRTNFELQILLGHDDRSSSLELTSSLIPRLTRMGISVLYAGRILKPAFCFGMYHHRKSAAIYVTGSGCGPAWTGMDFLYQQVQPISRSNAGSPVGDSSAISFQSSHNVNASLHTLEDIAAKRNRPFNRFSRTKPKLTQTEIESLWMKQIAEKTGGIRPLRMVIGVSSNRCQHAVQTILQNVPCQNHYVLLPTRKRNLKEPLDPDLQKVSHMVTESHAQLGFVLADDAQGIAVLDERGELVPSLELGIHLAEAMVDSGTSSQRAIMLLQGISSSCDNSERNLTHTSCQIQHVGSNASQMSYHMRQGGYILGTDHQSRYWFAGPYPICDALWTMVNFLHFMSEYELPLSRLNVNASAETFDFWSQSVPR